MRGDVDRYSDRCIRHVMSCLTPFLNILVPLTLNVGFPCLMKFGSNVNNCKKKCVALIKSQEFVKRLYSQVHRCMCLCVETMQTRKNV